MKDDLVKAGGDPMKVGGEPMQGRCALGALLSEGGPVRVSLRPCCVAALVGRRPDQPGGSARPAVPESEFVCAAAQVELQVTP